MRPFAYAFLSAAVFLMSAWAMIDIFIVGCVDIGCCVARLWQEKGVSVSALARSSRAARRLETLGVTLRYPDLHSGLAAWEGTAAPRPPVSGRSRE